MKIGFGGDHSSTELKKELLEYVKTKGYEVIDYGTNSTESVHYPVYGKMVAVAVKNGECDCGIVICGTGIGISIAANKVKGIRCALCSEPLSAKLTKEHNNANVIAIGARVTGVELAKSIVDAWLEAEYQGGRHEERVKMLNEFYE